MVRFILASASPRRKELLRQLIGDNFEVIVSSYEESTRPGLDAHGLVLHHSIKKARDVATRLCEGFIIAADTVILCDGTVLGKPISQDDALSSLEFIRGKCIKAITGVTLLDVSSGKEICFSESTDVIMRNYSYQEIVSYVSSGEPFGKAGSFAIQSKGAALVERVNGDPFNVVGLPLFSLGRILCDMGIDIFSL